MLKCSRIERNDCFSNCQHLMREQMGRRTSHVFKRLVYVEGRISNGLPHAWLKLDGEIWDPTRDEHWRETEPNYNDERPYPSDEFRELVERPGRDGEIGSVRRPTPFRAAVYDCDGIVINYRDDDETSRRD